MNTSSHPAILNKYFTPPFDNIGVIVLVATIFPFCVIGVIGNVITLATIIVSPRLKSTWYDLIFSLSVSDLISALISPFTVYRGVWALNEWKLPAFVCKLWYGFHYWTMFSTTVHILWFSVLRYISIKWPHSFSSVLTRYAKLSIFLIWFLTFATGFVPYLLVRPEIRDRSDPFPTSKWPACSPTKDLFYFYLIVSQATFVVYVLIPCILVVIASTAIGIRISTMRKERRNKEGDCRNQVTEEKRTRKENQLLLQLGLIVGSFILGYFPLVGFRIYTNLSKNSGPDATKLNWWLGAFQYIFLRLSECLNPFFYNLASSKMRKETMTLVRRFWLKITCKTDPPANGRHENPHLSNIAHNRTSSKCSQVQK